MKLDKDPRIVAGPGFMAALLEFLRKVSLAVNGLHDDSDTQAARIAALETQVADLEARVTALETP